MQNIKKLDITDLIAELDLIDNSITEKTEELKELLKNDNIKYLKEVTENLKKIKNIAEEVNILKQLLADLKIFFKTEAEEIQSIAVSLPSSIERRIEESINNSIKQFKKDLENIISKPVNKIKTDIRESYILNKKMNKELEEKEKEIKELFNRDLKKLQKAANKIVVPTLLKVAVAVLFALSSFNLYNNYKLNNKLDKVIYIQKIIANNLNYIYNKIK